MVAVVVGAPNDPNVGAFGAGRPKVVPNPVGAEVAGVPKPKPVAVVEAGVPNVEPKPPNPVEAVVAGVCPKLKPVPKPAEKYYQFF